MDNKIGKIYVNNLLNWENVVTMLDDMRSDGIVESEMDVECIADNLVNLMNDNCETIANELIKLYEQNK